MLNELTSDLRSMRLPGMALALERWVADPANSDRCALECVTNLIAAQREMRDAKRASSFQSRSRLAPHLTSGAFDPSNARGLSARQFQHLVSLAWLDARQDLVLTGPSRSGKTHLAAALAQEALNGGRTVRFERVPELLARLAEHADAAYGNALIVTLARPELLVLDDIATDMANSEQTTWLRRMIERRENRGAIIATSIADPEEWNAFFDNKAGADGIHGRLTDGGHEVTLKGRYGAKGARK